jgi:hypothetical protein
VPRGQRDGQITTGYGLDGQGSVPDGVYTGCGAHPAPLPTRTGDKVAGADRSPPSCLDVKIGGAIPLVPIRLHGVVLN